MDEEGLANPPDLPRLENLGLDKTKITDAGLDALRQFAGLRELHVEKTKVTSQGLARLKDALPLCKFFVDKAEKKGQASPAR